MDEQSSSQSDASPVTEGTVSKVYWYPHAIDLEEYSNIGGEETRRRLWQFVSENLVPGSNDGDIFLVAHPGPVLFGVFTYMGSQFDLLPVEATINWVSLGSDHRLSDIWITWQNGAPLTPTQIKGVADICDRLGAQSLALTLRSYGDESEPDQVAHALAEYNANESAVVTLRTARARTVAQDRLAVTVQDVVLGLLSPLQTDPISLALRNLADPEALKAIDSAVWSTSVTPGPGRDVKHAIRDLLGSAMTLGSGYGRNATILAALLLYGFDEKNETLATIFGAYDNLQDFASAIVAQRDVLHESGASKDLIQFDFFESALSSSSKGDGLGSTLGAGNNVPLSALIPEAERTASPGGSDLLLVPATRVDVPDGEDKLGIEDEAAAFARLIAYKKTRLPLSIGVFGHWGSGKTFFLNTVKKEIARLDSDDYYQNVVPIEFNAWQYMESNIWASLTSKIFKELLAAQKGEENKASTLKMFGALAAVQDTQIEAMEALINRFRAAGEAQDAYVQAVDAVQTEGPKSLQIAMSIFEQIKSKRTADIATLETALADEAQFRTVGEKKSRAAQLTRIDQDKNIFEFLDASYELLSSGRLLRSKLRKTFWSPFLLLPMAAALLAAPFGFSYLLELMTGHNYLSSGIAPVLATLTGGAGGAAIWVRKATKAFETAFAQVEKDLKDHPLLAEYKEARSAEILNVEAARQRLEKRTTEADNARDALMSETVLGRLSQLIKSRAEGDTYTKHLSVIATIRADFENLSTMLAHADQRAEEAKKWKKTRDDALAKLDELAKSAADIISKDKSRAAREARLESEAIARDRQLLGAPDQPAARPGDAIELTHYGKLADEMIKDARAKINDYVPSNTIDRVVLMIDDLDRCPPDKVYDVLQAVHLFLSFPLFAAMVGVDTRWMETSLKQQLGELVSGKNGATPRDYLEKIFQIPYWSKALQPTQAQAFVGSLLEDIDTRLTRAEAETAQTQQQQTASTNAPETGGADANANTATGSDQATQAPQSEQDQQEDATKSKKPKTPSQFAGPTKEEAAYLTKVSGYAGTTPRRVIRFLNIFLLIKTLPYGQRDIEQQRAIITQLAFCVGMPELAGDYFDELDKPLRGENIAQFSTRFRQRLKHVDADDRERIERLFETYAKHAGADPVTLLRDTAEIARKFTFASPEATELQTTGNGIVSQTSPMT